MSVIVYGHSDDLIEIEGDLEEEFDAYNSGSKYIAFDNGVLAEIHYSSSGVWRIDVLSDTESITSVVKAPLDDEENYSDVLEIRADISWAVCSETLVTS